MSVTIIKVECPEHPGRYTMGGPCDLCVTEDFRRRIEGICKGFLVPCGDRGNSH